MINRHLKDSGIEPFLAYIMLVLGFIGVSTLLFHKTEFAEYIYVLIALTIIFKLSESKRNDFLKICFSNPKLKIIRITENLIITFPFQLFLLSKQLILPNLVLLAISISLALFNFNTTFNPVIPTPFYKKPFEFVVGFRNTFYLIIPTYILTSIAAYVGNFNLGIFAMLFMFLLCLSYYSKPEYEYYVWNYNLNSKYFLFEKLKTALLFSFCLVLPIALLLGVFFIQKIMILLAFFLIGMLFLTATILSKYAAYPSEINITQGIILALCIWLQPLLIILIPYLFQKSKIQLSKLLP